MKKNSSNQLTVTVRFLIDNTVKTHGNIFKTW